MSLSKEDITKVDDLGAEEINVPEWGDTVFLRSMTGKERGEFESENSKHLKNGGLPDTLKSKLLAQTMVDEKGNRIFDNLDEGIKILGGKSGAVINRLFEKTWSISGFDPLEMAEFEKN